MNKKFLMIGAVIGAIVLLLLTACGGVDYPEGSGKGNSVLENIPEYSFLAKDDSGYTSTIEIYKNPLFYTVKDEDGLMDMVEVQAALKFLESENIDLRGARLEPSIEVFSNKGKQRSLNIFLNYEQNVQTQQNEPNIIVVGGGAVVSGD